MPSGARRALLVLAATLSGLLLLAAPAAAHQPGATLVTVRTAGADLDLVAQVPLGRIDYTYGTHLAGDPAVQVPVHEAWLRSLVARDVTLTSPGGARWAVRISSLRPSTSQGRRTVRLGLVATPPAGTHSARVDLRWRLVTDRLYSHKVYVGGRSRSGAVALVGILTHDQPVVTLRLDRAPSPEVSFGSMVSLGWSHFRQGVDHQLFLVLLALGAVRRRASGGSSVVRRLGVLTLCFTVGHSLSLALATSGLVVLPSRWVETGIALTILLTALHAVRPTVSHRVELAATVCFGLVHGFGFAGTLADLSLRGRELVVPVLGFNLGLEAAQLACLALVGVPLALVARSRPAVLALCGAVGLVAAGWILQRAVGVPDPLDVLVARLLPTPEVLALVLLAAGLLTVLVPQVPRVTPGRGPVSGWSQAPGPSLEP